MLWDKLLVIRNLLLFWWSKNMIALISHASKVMLKILAYECGVRLLLIFITDPSFKEPSWWIPEIPVYLVHASLLIFLHSIIQFFSPVSMKLRNFCDDYCEVSIFNFESIYLFPELNHAFFGFYYYRWPEVKDFESCPFRIIMRLRSHLQTMVSGSSVVIRGT